MASAAKSVGRTMLPALMSGSPSRSVEPRGRTPEPGSTATSSSNVTEPSSPMAAFSIITTASNASGKSSPVSART